MNPVAAIAKISAVPTLLRVISEITGMRLSLISHVTETEWTCCALHDELGFGLDVGMHIDIAITLCSEVHRSHQPLQIVHASTDPSYCTHPAFKLYTFESYVAYPIFLPNGEYFGNICALDSEPTALTDRMRNVFTLIAELIGAQLAAEAAQAATSRALHDERQTSSLREQFIAILGHDVRSPLSSITLGAEHLAARVTSDTEREIVLRIRRSAARISRLANDMLDFARGRLGGGVPLRVTPIVNVVDVFDVVIEELKAAHPDRSIDVDIGPVAPIAGDPDRLAQVLQNLLSNALTHSPSDARVGARIGDGEGNLQLQISNGGTKLSPELMGRMFQPFHRGTTTRPTGLGLGLYIASEIVRSHHGTIDVASDDDATTVTVRIPRDQRARFVSADNLS